MKTNTIRAAYQDGVGFEDFLAGVRANADHFRDVHRRLEFVGRDAASSVFPPGLRILILCEPFCADCVLNLPLIARLAEASGAALRVASCDGHQALADCFPGRDGLSRVPTVILLDRDWRDLGYWSERGRSDHDWMAAFTRADPLPAITLDRGMPAGAFADWLGRRLAAQLPIFIERNWRDVREELRALAADRTPAPARPDARLNGAVTAGAHWDEETGYIDDGEN